MSLRGLYIGPDGELLKSAAWCSLAMLSQSTIMPLTSYGPHHTCQPTSIDRWLQANDEPVPGGDERVLTTYLYRDVVDVRIEMMSQRVRALCSSRSPST